MSALKMIQSDIQSGLRQGLTAVPRSVLKLMAQILVRYRRQRQRICLARLDDRMLRDMGISRIDAERESAKPFWRD